MQNTELELPAVSSRGEGREARMEPLEREKEPTRKLDELNAERRRLPMVGVESDDALEGPEGEASLLDRFEGRRQLLVGTYDYLDLTPLGRQEDWEEPAGRSDSQPMGWLRRHDQYDDGDLGSGDE